MRQSIAAIALIRREHAGQMQWLAQWNRNWKRYSFVGGHKRSNESFRECVAREVAEELNLVEAIDFRIADGPPSHVEFTAWSESAACDTAYTMELFEVELICDDARQKIEHDDRNRWLAQSEIEQAQCNDGRPVSETMSRLLAASPLFKKEATP